MSHHLNWIYNFPSDFYRSEFPFQFKNMCNCNIIYTFEFNNFPQLRRQLQIIKKYTFVQAQLQNNLKFERYEDIATTMINLRVTLVGYRTFNLFFLFREVISNVKKTKYFFLNYKICGNHPLLLLQCTCVSKL